MSPVIAFRQEKPAAALGEKPKPEPKLKLKSKPVETGAPSNDWDVCPWSETLTAYDKRNIGIFSDLLCEEADGATEFDIARDVFGLDDWLGSQHTRAIVRSHLKRARWLSENVFPLLDW